MTSTVRLTLLGPQRLVPTLAPVLASLGVGSGRISTITAGWQEREPDDHELDTHLGGRTTNLRLYERTERVFQRDAAFAAAHRERQQRLRELQDLYNTRLDHAMAAAYELLDRPGTSVDLEREREAAIDAIRSLDARHLERVRAIHAEFEAHWQPRSRDAVHAERRELEALVQQSAAVAIAGGHVAVLLNRLRLFGFADLLRDRLVVAWSAGAMACAERVVLFHDHPADGMGNAEVLESGLGLGQGIVPLPHARRRLQLDRTQRVALFARRFAPDLCVPMNDGARLEQREGDWIAIEPTESAALAPLPAMRPDGTVGAREAA